MAKPPLTTNWSGRVLQAISSVMIIFVLCLHARVCAPDVFRISIIFKCTRQEDQIHTRFKLPCSLFFFIYIDYLMFNGNWYRVLNIISCCSTTSRLGLYCEIYWCQLQIKTLCNIPVKKSVKCDVSISRNQDLCLFHECDTTANSKQIRMQETITYLHNWHMNKFITHSVLLVSLKVIPNLNYWGRVSHICVCTLTLIESDNGLSPGLRQAIIWINAGILFIGPLGTKKNWYKFVHFHSRKSI